MSPAALSHRGGFLRVLPVSRHPAMPIKKTIIEAITIVLIAALLSLAYCAVSPVGRLLLKKALRATKAAAAPVAVEAGRHGP